MLAKKTINGIQLNLYRILADLVLVRGPEKLIVREKIITLKLHLAEI
jgi:hypothetical protein